MFLISAYAGTTRKVAESAAWTLTHAHDAGQVAGIRCARCNITRCYKPLELREVIGNVTIDEGEGQGSLPAMQKSGVDERPAIPSDWRASAHDPLPAPCADSMGETGDLAGRISLRIRKSPIQVNLAYDSC
ncbi:MAG: hypothetical protein E5X74_10005 [Mesorhizobium sp.]|uniref:hypothetical protein n=1 Tax=Mesorhizobium sp. TaxID=1871066 RepID=UPI0011F793D7|nr:hypothetical protein [Mesorhizobium sp.]TIO79326.1 MAG: hypothetical protein E5X75_01880 [Mesorhizobium sp.]TIO85940.1 MAG: hypothetical protein E5X74_10005 [Mesorhizobium sp.]